MIRTGWAGGGNHLGLPAAIASALTRGSLPAACCRWRRTIHRLCIESRGGRILLQTDAQIGPWKLLARPDDGLASAAGACSRRGPNAAVAPIPLPSRALCTGLPQGFRAGAGN